MERDKEDKERDGAARRERMRKQEGHIKSMTDVIGKEPSPRGEGAGVFWRWAEGERPECQASCVL